MSDEKGHQETDVPFYFEQLFARSKHTISHLLDIDSSENIFRLYFASPIFLHMNDLRHFLACFGCMWILAPFLH
jgi:hypothetical protein